MREMSCLSAAVVKEVVKKALGDMEFNTGGGAINWFPGHMAAATRAIRQRLKLADLVIEVRDCRFPLSSVNADLQEHLSRKRRVIALNKKDLANTNVVHKWVEYFESRNVDCLPISAHSGQSVKKLLDLVQVKLKEAISREPTLLVMVVGVPNVGKSALINSIHQIASSRFPVERVKRATVGPLPGVTQDIAGYKIAHRPSIYVLDTPGILVPSIPDIETGLKLALAGSIKDAVVGEERIVQYLLAVLNIRGTPLHWKPPTNSTMESTSDESMGKREYNIKDLLPKKRRQPNASDVLYIEDLVGAVKRTLYESLSEFDGKVEDENDLELLIDKQFDALQKAMKIPHKSSDARMRVSKKFLTLFRSGKLGTFILDDVPDVDLQNN
ncbi:hypothetical protein MLD38_033191 [Melastoma candidum]|uniref:Uncharacterized protein n=1 Tax=Melastoma candidum TaxID=119954 RepID=A0ACB9M6I5_9MYRT|nr:hypothetical protein MLD38_033191 [Melastoma candidum]